MKKRPLIVAIALNAHHAMLAIGLGAMAVFAVGGYPWAAAVLPFCVWSTFALAALCAFGSLFANAEDCGMLRAMVVGILLPACMYLSAYLHPSDEMARWM